MGMVNVFNTWLDCRCGSIAICFGRLLVYVVWVYCTCVVHDLSLLGVEHMGSLDVLMVSSVGI